MQDPSWNREFTAFLVNGAGTIVLALAGGVGGSALLELLWKPRRDKRRAAAALTADIAHNLEVLLLQAHARFKNPKAIPADFAMSTVGWTAVGNLISELPPDTLRKVVLLYNQFAGLNRDVDLYASLFSEYKAAPGGSALKQTVETHMLYAIDTFNTGIDSTIDNAQILLPHLARLARMKDEPGVADPDFAGRANKLVKDRTRRISDMRKHP
jgi:hypothetical protein